MVLMKGFLLTKTQLSQTEDFSDQMCLTSMTYSQTIEPGQLASRLGGQFIDKGEGNHEIEFFKGDHIIVVNLQSGRGRITTAHKWPEGIKAAEEAVANASPVEWPSVPPANDNTPLRPIEPPFILDEVRENLLDEAHRLKEIVGADFVDDPEGELKLYFRHKFTTTTYNVETGEVSGGFEAMREEVDKAIRNEVPVRRPGSPDSDGTDYDLVETFNELKETYGGFITASPAKGGCVLVDAVVEGRKGFFAKSIDEEIFFKSESCDFKYLKDLRPLVRATAFELEDPSTIPEREFLFDQHYIRQYMTVTIGAGGGGKSAHSITEALAMATGRPLLDPEGPLAEPLRVWLINCEDPHEEIQRRIAGAAIHFGISNDQLDSNLFVDSGRDQDFVIVKQAGKDLAVCEPLIEDMLREIQQNEIDVVIVDPFVSTHHAPENDNSAMQRVAAAWVDVADRGNCSVELIHHISKGMGPVTADSGRGAGAVKDKARSVRVINPMSETDAAKAGVEDHTAYFRIGKDKANMASKANTQKWRRFVSVNLNNGTGLMNKGDSVGVVEAWRWPTDLDVTEDVSAEQLAEIKQRLIDEDSRVHIAANEWAGYTVADVLGMDVSVKGDKTKINTMLQQWLKRGELKIIEKPDANRKLKDFYAPVFEE